MSKKVSYLHDHSGYWMNRLGAMVHQSFVIKLAAFGVTIPEWGVLIILYHHPMAPLSYVAEQIVIDRAAVSRTVEKLVQGGYLLRHVGKDRRFSPLELTDKAKELVPLLAEQADLNDREFYGILTSEEEQLFKKLIYKLINGEKNEENREVTHNKRGYSRRTKEGF